MELPSVMVNSVQFILRIMVLSILDPLPHDKPYFESHLEFVKNYFEKVSNGNLHIAYTLLPDTFSVSKTMRNYSPENNSNDFTPLANFSKEVWEKLIR